MISIFSPAPLNGGAVDSQKILTQTGKEPNMLIDLDSIVSSTSFAWDLSLAIGGVHYKTRKPTIAEQAAIFSNNVDPVKAFAALGAMIVNDNKPDFATMQPEMFLAIISAIGAFNQSMNNVIAGAVAKTVERMTRNATKPVATE